MLEVSQSTRPRILVVDDDPVVIQTIVNYLKGSYDLAIAKTRKRALELLANSDFDVVLLDINLPDGNGIDICTEIKSSRDYSESLTIIFVTSEYSSEQEAKGLNVGASDYIYKPVNKDVLLARLKIQINIQRKAQLLANLAQIDSLTEIGNRRAFDEQLENECSRAKRESKSLSLALLDIDYFKAYNDLYGHPAGDACLRQLAQCLKKACKRASDFCFRYGGEEFAIVFYDTPHDMSVELVGKMLVEFEALHIVHEGSLVSDVTTFSAGVLSASGDELVAENMLLEADKRLYEAKESGRNRVKG